MLNPSVQACESIIFLKNCHFSSQGKQNIQTVNTCPFDCVFAAVSVMYADHKNVKQQIDHLINPSDFILMIFNAFIDVARVSVKHNALLRKRNQILQTVFEGTDYGNGLLYVDCAANVNYLIPKILPQELYSYYRKKSVTAAVI